MPRIELKDFTAQPCKSRLAFEFLPRLSYSLDLPVIAQQFRDHEVSVEVETPFLLMLKLDGCNISFFKSGKIIVKDTQDKETAQHIAQKLVAFVE